MEEKIVLDSKSFEALAAGTRVRILKSLLSRRKTLSEIAKEFGMSVSGLKEHFDVLLDAGLVVKVDDGHKWKYYELTDKGRSIVTPNHKGARILLLLSVSFIAFVVSLHALLVPAISEDTMLAAETSLQNGGSLPLPTPEKSTEAESLVATGEPDSDTDDSAGNGQPTDTSKDYQTSAGADESREYSRVSQHTDAPKENEPGLDIPLVVAILSFGVMLVCAYELAGLRR